MNDLPISGTVFFVFCFSLVNSVNILIIVPTASFSHQMPFQVLAKALVQKGHSITMIGTNPLKEPIENYTDIDLSFSYKYFRPPPKDANANIEVLVMTERNTKFVFLENVIKATNAYTEDQLASEQIQSFVKSVDDKKVKFDLVLFEGLIHTAYLGLIPKLGNPPFISMVTLNPMCLFGIYDDSFMCIPSHIPDVLSGYTEKMNLFQRMDNFLLQLYSNYKRIEMLKHQNSLVEKYLGLPGFHGEEWEKKRTLLFVSSFWLLAHPRPMLPNVILLGPLHIQKIKPLNEDLQAWMDGAKDGVIYFSLGSNMRSASMKEIQRNAFLEAFREFSTYRVIWKWEDDTLPNISPNVICRKWLPQQSVLNHSKVKLFITQGGLQSSQEAVYFGVPIIGIPIFADQDTNVRRLESLGIGKFLDFEAITKELVQTTIRSILDDKKIYEKVSTYSILAKSQIMSPVDTALWWIEYVLKAKGNLDHLKLNLTEIPWYQFIMLDVIAVISGALLITFYVMYRISKLLLAILFCQKKGNKKRKVT